MSETNWREDDRQRTSFGYENPKRPQTKYFARTPDSTPSYYLKCHSTVNNNNNKNNSNSTESLYNTYHPTVKNLAIRNYLNQTIPSRVEEQTQSFPCRTRNNTDCRMILRSNPSNIEKLNQSITNCQTVNGNNRSRNGPLNRCHVAGTQSKHFIDEIGTNSEKKLTPIRDSPFLESYTQSHGVITASAYKDLRNGTIRW